MRRRPWVSERRVRMNGQLLIRIVGLVTATVTLVAGVIVTAGLFVPEYIPSNFRITIGIVLMLYGVYRAATIWVKYQQEQRKSDRSHVVL